MVLEPSMLQRPCDRLQPFPLMRYQGFPLFALSDHKTFRARAYYVLGADLFLYCIMYIYTTINYLK